MNLWTEKQSIKTSLCFLVGVATYVSAAGTDPRIETILKSVRDVPGYTYFKMEGFDKERRNLVYSIKTNLKSFAILEASVDSNGQVTKEMASVKNERYWFTAKKTSGRIQWLLTDFGEVSSSAAFAVGQSVIEEHWNSARNLLYFGHGVGSELVSDLLASDQITNSIIAEDESTITIHLHADNDRAIISHTNTPLRFNDLDMVLDKTNNYKVRSWESHRNNGENLMCLFSSTETNSDSFASERMTAGDFNVRITCIEFSHARVDPKDFQLSAFGLTEPPQPSRWKLNPAFVMFCSGMALIIIAWVLRRNSAKRA